jgi:hypothetical protein
LTMRTTSRSRARPAPPISLKPAVMITTAPTPLRPQVPAWPGHGALGRR